MLAYVFWHRPAPGVAPEVYDGRDQSLPSLARRAPARRVRPLGVASRAAAPNWLGDGAGFEDWYVVEDFAALGVLNEAAVGRGHLSAHDAAARHAGPGTRQHLPAARGHGDARS